MKKFIVSISFLLFGCSAPQKTMNLSFESACLRVAESVQDVSNLDIAVFDKRTSSIVGHLIAEDGVDQGMLITPADFTENFQKYARKRLKGRDANVVIEVTDLSCGFSYDLFRPVSFGSMKAKVEVTKGSEVKFSEVCDITSKETYFISGEKVAATIVESLCVEMIDRLLTNGSFTEALDA